MRLLNTPVTPYHWLGLAVLIGTVDFLLGPALQFPLLFLLPVGLASWHGGRAWGLSLAIALPLIRLAFWYLSSPPWTLGEAVANFGIRVIVFGSFSFAVELAARRTREVRILRGTLPICAYCKKIRNEQNKWEVLEAYIIHHSEASFTHGICPDCTLDHFVAGPPGHNEGKRWELHDPTAM